MRKKLQTHQLLDVKAQSRPYQIHQSYQKLLKAKEVQDYSELFAFHPFQLSHLKKKKV